VSAIAWAWAWDSGLGSRGLGLRVWAQCSGVFGSHLTKPAITLTCPRTSPHNRQSRTRGTDIVCCTRRASRGGGRYWALHLMRLELRAADTGRREERGGSSGGGTGGGGSRARRSSSAARSAATSFSLTSCYRQKGQRRAR
jgi:hypothetical protein